MEAIKVNKDIAAVSVTELEPSPTETSRSLSRQWKQTAPTRYERPLDDMESFAIAVHTIAAEYGRQQWAMSTGIKIRTSHLNFVENLKAVWIALRYRHPILATKVEAGKLVYQTADDSELDSWLAETFIIDTSPTTGAELYGTTPRPFKRPTLNVLPHTQELIIQTAHTHLDGLGAATLFNNLLHLLSKPPPAPTFGDEAKNLLSPFSILSQTPPLTAEHQARWNSSLQTWGSAFPTLGLAASNTSAVPGRSRMLSLTFTGEATASIVAASREMGITVTHALQAAIALATRTHGGQSEKDTFATFAIYNAREYCLETHAQASDFVSNHMTASPVVFRLGSSFRETAQSAREIFVSNKAERYSLSAFPTLCAVLPAMMAAPLPVPASAPLLSSFGDLDGRLRGSYSGEDREKGRGVELEDFWCTLDTVTPDLYVGVWTLLGRLRLQIGYNETYHEKESIQLWAEMVRGELEKGLGVELKIAE